MKKLSTILCLIIAVITLSSCSSSNSYKASGATSWEREKLTSNLHIKGPRAQNLLDRDLAECATVVSNRQAMEEKVLTTKKCEKKDGLDWKAIDNGTFLRQCMQRKGWVPSNCCSYSKNCSCK